jgi:hypothetical protein
MYDVTERFIISLESSDEGNIFGHEDSNDKRNRTDTGQSVGGSTAH